MCGLAFSGKTTLARAIAGFTGATYVGLDDINRERGVRAGGEGLPVEEWERTHRLATERVERLMAGGAPIVVDDTSNLRLLRDRFRALAGRHGYELVLVHMDVPLDEIRRRMEENEREPRRGGIRESVFAEHVGTFEWPAEDEEAVVFRPGLPVDEWLRVTLSRTELPSSLSRGLPSCKTR